jgi:hypothetical protein
MKQYNPLYDWKPEVILLLAFTTKARQACIYEWRKLAFYVSYRQ